MNFFNKNNQTVHAKTIEKKRNKIQYYGIGSNNTVIDFEANTPIQARSYFEMEFNAQGTELNFMGAYAR
ncbi:hypothetical protein [Brevibacillus porteri]|uniref:hypothetical protein n=1 Tax=Brevibacillus porteri TaxID=2126350 RepID=UPI00363F7006